MVNGQTACRNPFPVLIGGGEVFVLFILERADRGLAAGGVSAHMSGHTFNSCLSTQQIAPQAVAHI